MLLFSVAAIALAAVAIAIILPALQGRRRINADDSEQQNIRVARRRLDEIDAGLIDDTAQTRTEIEAALLDDLPANAADKSAGKAPPKTPGKAWTTVIVRRFRLPASRYISPSARRMRCRRTRR